MEDKCQSCVYWCYNPEHGFMDCQLEAGQNEDCTNCEDYTSKIEE